MDAYVQVSVSVPGHEPFGFKLKVKNPYGVMKRADDPRKVFQNLIASALARTFGAQAVAVETSYTATKRGRKA